LNAPEFLPASTILARLLTVDANNSGLNANTLQGYQASAFSLAGHTHSYQPLDAELTAIAGLASAADKLPYFTGSGAASLADFTIVGRNVVAATTQALARTALGLGTIATAADTAYLLATGATTGASASVQTLTLGAKLPKIQPLADSTNAFGLYRANGTTQDGYYDSTNGRWGWNRVPVVSFDVTGVHVSGTGLARFTGDSVSGFMSLDTVTQVSAEAGFLLKTGGTLIGQIGVRSSDNVVYIKNRALNSNDVISVSSLGYVGIGNVTAPTALLEIIGSTAARASLRLRSGVAPTSPNAGDVYQDGTHAYMYLAGSWKQLDN